MKRRCRITRIPRGWRATRRSSRTLQKEYQETFDDAIDRKAKKLAARNRAVKAKMAAAKQKVAAMQPVEKKNVYLGSRLVARYGCFACHDIHGFETAKPIGTELSEWGSKPVDKLDFGLLDIEKDRIAWLKQKLHAPRSFDTGRIGVTRMPQELLKMPKFNLTDDQIDQIVTVISGMTDEKLTPERGAATHARGIPDRARPLDGEGVELRRLSHRRGAGRRDPRDGNPAGHGAADADRDADAIASGPAHAAGLAVQFPEVAANGRDSSLAACADADVRVDDGEANVIVKYFAMEGRAQFPYQTPKIDTSPEHLAAGKQLFDAIEVRAVPHCRRARRWASRWRRFPRKICRGWRRTFRWRTQRLQRDWLVNKWLVEPLAQMPGTRMPQFEYGTAIAPNILGGDGRKQIEALVDYVLTLGAHEQTPRQRRRRRRRHHAGAAIRRIFSGRKASKERSNGVKFGLEKRWFQ